MKVTIRTKELKNGNHSIYLDVYDKGKRKYEYLRLYLVPEVDDNTKRRNKNAMKKAQEIRSQYVLGTSELLKPEVKLDKTTALQDWLCEYVRRLQEERNVSEATRWQAEFVKTIIEDYLAKVRKKNIKISDFGRAEMVGLLKYLNEFEGERCKHYSPNTLKTCQQRIVAIFNAAIHEGLIVNNPITLLSDKEVFSKVASTKQPLTIEELERIVAVDAKYPIIRDAFLFACLTGLRISDIRSLKWSDIHDVAGRPTIVKTQVKTNGVVSVPICDTALRYMPTHKWDEYVFHLPCKTCIRQEIIRIAKAADIQKPMSFHTSRHTFASLMVSAGEDIKTVSTLLGHQSVDTTAIYADVEMKSKEAAMSGLSILF